jgi:Ca2+-binding EF-hand superfamily protein/diadenosine tetraphosphatase ApaH/serine/threonine PP2A family protein phosphatase
MGFEEEVLNKYEDSAPDYDTGRGRRMYELLSTVFDCLPLCHLVEKKIFVVHGGLSSHRGITLAHLKNIKRKREPPLHGTNFEDKLIEDMLWSDPRNINGTQASERGAGIEFGQEVTNNFCAVNSVALIIRSHECVMEGFEVLHGGRLITLFSASRYCGTQTNKGAFLTLGRDLQPAIQQFYAHSIQQADFGVSSEDTSTKQGQLEQRLEDDVCAMIIERICDHKPSLYWYFTQHDAERTGTVSRLEWANTLRNVIGIDLPFITYQHLLAEAEEDGNINYAKFLERYQIKMADQHSQWQEGVIANICQKIFQAMGAGNIKQAFQAFDTDGDDYIEYEEFMNTLKELDVGLSEQQIFELMRSVDVDNDSKIDFKEFAERFEVVFNRVNGESAAADLDDWTKASMQRIGTALYAEYGDQTGGIAQAFAAFDQDSNKLISFEEFAQGVANLNLLPAFSTE